MIFLNVEYVAFKIQKDFESLALYSCFFFLQYKLRQLSLLPLNAISSIAQIFRSLECSQMWETYEFLWSFLQHDILQNVKLIEVPIDYILAESNRVNVALRQDNDCVLNPFHVQVNGFDHPY